jgi:hypothetical protein
MYAKENDPRIETFPNSKTTINKHAGAHVTNTQTPSSRLIYGSLDQVGSSEQLAEIFPAPRAIGVVFQSAKVSKVQTISGHLTISGH